MEKKRLNEWMGKRRNRKASLNHDALLEGILKGEIRSLSSAITLLESENKEDQKIARQIVNSCLSHAGKSVRIGITGVPGVGKSTFIESFGQLIVEKGGKIAVLAIDPSSEKSGGSILGDKTRMNNLSQQENAFIRPSAAGKSLGGVARKTRESIVLCEAAGFDHIIIETVGVGQSETVVHSMVDFFLLLMLSGAGDELQGIKRGIMEMADALVITKADGDNLNKAQIARREYDNAMHLFPPNENGWIPRTLVCSANENLNIDKVLKTVNSYVNHTKINGFFAEKRKKQDKYWLHETLVDLLLKDFYGSEKIKKKMISVEKELLSGKLSSFEAAERLLKIYRDEV
ncbi:MAG: methylmalonyl Co-A mutase-associated GTPase MeaB [Brumimicrobium sp.]|nr:methylmalonyl Co-A mutase-associated GTPase MeaB [Brumimicrobium sp.]